MQVDMQYVLPLKLICDDIFQELIGAMETCLGFWTFSLRTQSSGRSTRVRFVTGICHRNP